MENAGIYSLLATAVTTALSAQAQDPITDLDGMTSATFLCELLYGSGGTSIDVLAQTTFDGGSTWLDVARFSFTTSAAKKTATVVANVAAAVAGYSALAAEGVNAGLLGDQLRAVVTSVGTYVNTTVSLRVHAK